MKRPQIFDYKEPEDYIREMILFHKNQDSSFSVHSKAKELRRISPALITLIVQKKRKLTYDRVDEISKLLELGHSEKDLLKKWLLHRPTLPAFIENKPSTTTTRYKKVSAHLLSEWLNVYVKDCFQIEAIQNNPSFLYNQLSQLASPKRIDQSLRFLLREGYLRKTLDGKIVQDTPLTVTEPESSQKSVRQFHKAALEIAKRGLETFSIEERIANTFVMPIDDQMYEKISQLLKEFSMNLNQILSSVECEKKEGLRLYQLTLNLSPIGGKSK